jgi:hypothetical protein
MRDHSMVSHGRGLTSVMYDIFCIAFPDAHCKNTKRLKSDAEKYNAYNGSKVGNNSISIEGA